MAAGRNYSSQRAPREAPAWNYNSRPAPRRAPSAAGLSPLPAPRPRRPPPGAGPKPGALGPGQGGLRCHRRLRRRWPRGGPRGWAGNAPAASSRGRTGCWGFFAVVAAAAAVVLSRRALGAGRQSAAGDTGSLGLRLCSPGTAATGVLAPWDPFPGCQITRPFRAPLQLAGP